MMIVVGCVARGHANIHAFVVGCGARAWRIRRVARRDNAMGLGGRVQCVLSLLLGVCYVVEVKFIVTALIAIAFAVVRRRRSTTCFPAGIACLRCCLVTRGSAWRVKGWHIPIAVGTPASLGG